MPDSVSDLWSELRAASADRPPLPVPPESTQARIVAAALELFAERSYEAATTQAIARRAGVTERTLFKHFKSKEGLFAHTVYPALLELVRPIATADLRRVLQEQRGDFRSTVRAIVAERVGFAMKHPAIVKMLAQELLLRPAFRQVALGFIAEQMGPLLETLFAEARASGQMRDIPTAVAVRTLVSNVVGYVLTRLALLPDVPCDERQDIELIGELILDGLATPKPVSP